MKNGQSRETDNIGYKTHRTKTNKAKHTTQKTKKYVLDTTNRKQTQILKNDIKSLEIKRMSTKHLSRCLFDTACATNHASCKTSIKCMI